VLVIVTVFSITGVAATWQYATGNASSVTTSWFANVREFLYAEGDNEGEMVSEELALTNRLVDIFNGNVSENLTQAQIDMLESAIQERRGEGWRINELLADDKDCAAEMKDVLGLKDDTELTVIIKFVDDNANDNVPDYELFTTRVDVDGKDENGNYIIPEDRFANENGYIYPVNRTTFIYKDGKLVVNNVEVGYSRTIYYWENNAKTETRTYDVTQWATGKNQTEEDAVIVNNTGDYYIYYDIGKIGNTDDTTLYLRHMTQTQSWFGISSSASAFGTMSIEAPYEIANIGRSGGQYYGKITYNPATPEETPPSAKTPRVVRFANV